MCNYQPQTHTMDVFAAMRLEIASYYARALLCAAELCVTIDQCGTMAWPQ